MSTDRASLAAVWCIYCYGTETSAPLFTKHLSGIALLGFRTQQLAEAFLSICRISQRSEAVLISQLGTTAYPNHPGWMHKTDQVMLISSIDDVRNYARDQEAFIRSSALWTIPFLYGPHPQTAAPNEHEVI